MSEHLNPSQDLYVVEFERRPGDLGVSVIVRACGLIEAKIEAFRRFPEHKRCSRRMFVGLLDYAEIDWNSGQSFVVKRKRRLPIPFFAIDERKPSGVRKKRDEGEAK